MVCWVFVTGVNVNVCFYYSINIMKLAMLGYHEKKSGLKHANICIGVKLIDGWRLGSSPVLFLTLMWISFSKLVKIAQDQIEVWVVFSWWCILSYGVWIE